MRTSSYATDEHEQHALFGCYHHALGRALRNAPHTAAATPLPEHEQEERLTGALWKPPVKPFEPVRHVIEGARSYAASRGMSDPHPHGFHHVMRTPDDVREIGRAYHALPDHDPKAVPHYESLRNEVNHQFEHMTKRMGIKFEPVEHDPYKSGREMAADLHNNKRIQVLKTSVTGPHPFFSDEENDRFRAVHDVFGHAATGRSFDKHGEEAAWVAHSQMFTPHARRALTTETRGQNSFYNLNGQFADQKVALLPKRHSDHTGYLLGQHTGAKDSHFDGVSLKQDDDGWYVYTHRARSDSYPSPEEIPDSAIKFIRSTGAKKDDREISVAGLAIQAEDTGRILMLQRSYKHKKDPARGCWEFPGGHVEKDEAPVAAAIREWEEEIGSKAPHGDIVGTWRSGDIYQGFVMLVPTEDDVDVNLESRDVLNPDDPDGDDIETAAWFALKDIPKMPALRQECRKTDWDVFRPAARAATAALSTRAAGLPKKGRQSMLVVAKRLGSMVEPGEWWTPQSGLPLHAFLAADKPDLIVIGEKNPPEWHDGFSHGVRGEEPQPPDDDEKIEAYFDGHEEGRRLFNHGDDDRRHLSSLQTVAHDSGDGETIFHCPFCGSGQVIARSDGTVECEFCTTAFTVQVQPEMMAMPQTIDGVPVDIPGMPNGGENAMVPPQDADADGVPDDEEGFPGEEPEDEEEDEPSAAPEGNPFAKKSYITHAGIALDEDSFLRHLAIQHAGNRRVVIEQVRADRQRERLG